MPVEVIQCEMSRRHFDLRRQSGSSSATVAPPEERQTNQGTGFVRAEGSFDVRKALQKAAFDATKELQKCYKHSPRHHAMMRQVQGWRRPNRNEPLASIAPSARQRRGPCQRCSYPPHFGRGGTQTLAGLCPRLSFHGGGGRLRCGIVVSHVVNAVYVSQDLRATFVICSAIVGIFAIKGLATYGQAVTLASVGSAITAEFQMRMFDKTLRENLGYFANRHSSEFNAQMNFAAGAVGGVLTTLVTAAGRDLLTLAGLFAVMVKQDPILSLAALLVMPPAVFTVRNIRTRLHHLIAEQYGRGAAMLETGQEVLQGLRIVKAFGLEDAMRQRFHSDAGIMRTASIKIARAANSPGPLMEALGGAAVALVFFYGACRVLWYGATPGAFFSFVTAFLLAYEPAKRLARLHVDLTSGLLGARMLFDRLDSPATEPDDSGKPDLRVTDGRIELIDVDFAYRPGEPVLRHMSFAAEARQLTALVGTSGGGKSTVFNLLLRFYEPSSGRIMIDGQDISAVSLSSLRRQIAYVGQDTFLFRGSIRQNIAVGKANAGDDEIVSAAQTACAHDFIMSFPQGYETQVGEQGLQLSTGQRQRIAIARALIKDAPVILLDEPTAALDNLSERQVRDATLRLCRGRTTIAIAHRLHTIAEANCIHVIDAGAVVESGRHDDLLRRGGRYALFYRLHLVDENSPDSVALKKAI
jgi:subfamily B ATP-binding cassette protein MsbA